MKMITLQLLCLTLFGCNNQYTPKDNNINSTNYFVKDTTTYIQIKNLYCSNWKFIKFYKDVNWATLKVNNEISKNEYSNIVEYPFIAIDSNNLAIKIYTFFDNQNKKLIELKMHNKIWYYELARWVKHDNDSVYNRVYFLNDYRIKFEFYKEKGILANERIKINKYYIDKQRVDSIVESTYFYFQNFIYLNDILKNNGKAKYANNRLFSNSLSQYKIKSFQLTWVDYDLLNKSSLSKESSYHKVIKNNKVLFYYLMWMELKKMNSL